jgi:hypothetical protein
LNSVSVTFTAPSNVGGSAITGYTVQAIKTSDGSITFTTGASSPISVTGLSATAYTFKVLATNSYGSSVLSAASNSTSPLIIGGAYAGGYFAGQISTAGNGIADYNLVIGPKASAQASPTKQWKNTNSDTFGAASVIDGPQNTADIVADGNSTVYPAAHFCNDLVIGGFSDWYMPAQNELEVCYYNLKPTTASNNTSSGTNTNAVPSRGSNYTSGTPAQTSAAAFQSGNAEAFTEAAYWASTESAFNRAWTQFFDVNGGLQFGGYKYYTRNVRGVRRVAV